MFKKHFSVLDNFNKKHTINIDKIYINNDIEKTNSTKITSHGRKSRDKNNSKSFSTKYSTIKQT